MTARKLRHRKTPGKREGENQQSGTGRFRNIIAPGLQFNVLSSGHWSLSVVGCHLSAAGSGVVSLMNPWKPEPRTPNPPVGIVYFRRYRMEIDLSEPLLPQPAMPADYRLTPWNERLLEVHAQTKFECFRSEMDANVFPSLSTRDGCRRLMTEITCRGSFVPEATWLLEHWPAGSRRPQACGTIQGVAEEKVGAIQNVGVTPPHRGLGLGSVLLWHSLAGFQAAGIGRVFLEVTSQNSGACRLYERLGFRRKRVVYKAAEVAYAEA